MDVVPRGVLDGASLCAVLPAPTMSSCICHLAFPGSSEEKTKQLTAGHGG